MYLKSLIYLIQPFRFLFFNLYIKKFLFNPKVYQKNMFKHVFKKKQKKNNPLLYISERNEPTQLMHLSPLRNGEIISLVW